MLFEVQISQRSIHSIVVAAPDREAIRRHAWHEFRRDASLADPRCHHSEVVSIQAVRTPEDDRPVLEALADPDLDPLERELLEGSERAPDPMPTPDLVLAACTERDEPGDRDLRAREAEAIWHYFRYCYEQSVCIAMSEHQGVSMNQEIGYAIEAACYEFPWWPEEDVRAAIEDRLYKRED
jgi:hypothetical protein